MRRTTEAARLRINALARARYAENREERRAKSRARYQRNIARRREVNRQYYRRHRAAIFARQKARLLRNWPCLVCEARVAKHPTGICRPCRQRDCPRCRRPLSIQYAGQRLHRWCQPRAPEASFAGI